VAGDQLKCGAAIPMLAPAFCVGEFLLRRKDRKFADFGEISRQSGVDRRGLDPDDGPERDGWEDLNLVIEEGWSRVAFLLRSDVDLGELLEQPPTNQKRPERVLWESIFALLWECGIKPLERHQPLIHTLRAAHRLFGIDELPNAGSVGYVKSEFLKTLGQQR
jgi:hypothetical protein